MSLFSRQWKPFVLEQGSVDLNPGGCNDGPGQRDRGKVIIYDHWGHMVSTESARELHDFARAMGLDRRLYHVNGRGEHHAHYDLLDRHLKERAGLLGAVKVRARELVERAWWSRRPLPFRIGPAE